MLFTKKEREEEKRIEGGEGRGEKRVGGSEEGVGEGEKGGEMREIEGEREEDIERRGGREEEAPFRGSNTPLITQGMQLNQELGELAVEGPV